MPRPGPLNGFTRMSLLQQFPKIISHRGMVVDGLTNTIPAFEAAVAAGAEMVEMDIHETRDGHFVVFHDDAPAPDAPPWSAMTYRRVRKMTAGSDRAPELGACLEALNPVPVDMEIKTCRNVDNLVRRLSELAPCSGSFASSFDVNLLKKMHLAGARLPLVLIVSLSWRHAPGRIFKNLLLCLVPQMLPGFLRGAAIHYELAGKFMIKALQRKGLAVYVWTVDREDQMKKFDLLGVDGTVTNYPRRLQALRGF